MSFEGGNNTDISNAQLNQMHLNEAIGNQEELIVNFSEISEKLQLLLPEISVDYVSKLEFAFEGIDDEQKQKLLSYINNPLYAGAVAEVFNANIPTDDLEYILDEINNTISDYVIQETKAGYQETEAGHQETEAGYQETEAGHQKTEVENIDDSESKSKEFKEFNKKIIESLGEEFERFKNSEEGQAILQKAKIQIKNANPGLTEQEIDIYADTYLLLENKDQFLESNPELEQEFQALADKMKLSEVFENIGAIDYIKKSTDLNITDNQIQSIIGSNTAEGGTIKIDGNKVTVGDQEYTIESNGTLKKHIVSGEYKFTSPIEHKQDYFLLAEKREVNKSISEIDNKIGEKNIELEHYQEFLLDAESDLNTETELSLQEKIKGDIENFKKKINEIESSVDELEERKTELILRLKELEEKERVSYRDALNDQSDIDNQRRDVLKFIKQIGLDVIDQSELELILLQIRTTEIDMNIAGIDEGNIDLANGVFGQREGLGMDVMKENLLKLFNKMISGNENEPLIIGEYNGALSKRHNERKDMIKMLTDNNVINYTGELNIKVVKDHLNGLTEK